VDVSEETTTLYTCMACEEFSTIMSEMLIAHQTMCEKMDEEKKEYRKFLLTLYFPEDAIPQVLELTKQHGERQKKEV
jgi:hypothetical protein